MENSSDGLCIRLQTSSVYNLNESYIYEYRTYVYGNRFIKNVASENNFKHSNVKIVVILKWIINSENNNN